MPGEFIAPTDRIESFEYHLKAVGDRATAMKPIMEDILDKILAREHRMFETGGASSGVIWAPLRRSTIKRKARDKQSGGYPTRPLWRTGDLMRSLSVRHARYQVLDVDDEGIELATTHPAAAVHAGGHGVPVRPPLIIPAKHAHEYVGMMNDFIFGEGNA